MFTEEKILEIFEEYKNGDFTIKSIGEKYSFNAAYYFKKHNLTKRRLNSERNGSFKLNWFGDNITNEIEAYILGFWYADGTISYGDQAVIKLKNTESDLELLSKIKNYFCTDLPIKKENNTIILKISSNLLCSNFNKLGCVYEKTNKDLNIPEMDKSLLRHFIRGYFDGDGTVFYDRIYLKANICSVNIKFLEKLQNILNNFNINTRINVEIRKGKELKTPCKDSTSTNFKDMYRLFISKKEDLVKFKNFLYEDSTIFLSRKKDIFYKKTLS